MRLASIDDITAAARRLDGRIVPTPLLPCPRLSRSLGFPISLKAENLQHTGSFKVRGVLNALLSRQERGDLPRGVTTFSAGNHAAATAFAANALRLPSIVCMPPGAVVTKVEAVHRYGGEIVFTDDLLGTCQGIARDRGYELLHPFDDPDVIAGQGTVGAELVRDAPDTELVLVPVGGGGLISGVAAAVKAASVKAAPDTAAPVKAASDTAASDSAASDTATPVKAASGIAAPVEAAAPGARVVGVEPVTANAMNYALRGGTPAPLPDRPVSIADGLTAPFAGEHTLAHVREFVDDVVELPEDAILPAWWELLDASKLLVEPSAAVGLAALRSKLVKVSPGTPTVLVLSGGNVAPATLARLTETA